MQVVYKATGVYLTSMNPKKSKDSHKSRSSRASRGTRLSKSSKNMEIEERMKVAELIAEVELLQQKQLIQNEAEKLKLKERLTKAKIRIQVCNTSRFAKFEIEQERGAVITKKEQNP